MLVFDKFPDEKKAKAFMAAVTKKTGLKAYLCRQENKWLFEINYKPGKTLLELRRDAKAQAVKKGYPGAEQVNVNTLRPDGVLDVFPFELVAPIVCVTRQENRLSNKEDVATGLVKSYGGVFVGT